MAITFLDSSLLDANEDADDRENNLSSVSKFFFCFTFSVDKNPSHPTNIFPKSLVSSRYAVSRSYICFSINCL